MKSLFNRILGKLGFSYTLIDQKDLKLITPKYRRKKNIFTAYLQGENIYNFISILPIYNASISILDLGCGDGCVAASFARNNHKGQYYGFDINNNWIKRINSVFLKDENFTFKYIDIFHSYYNKNGKLNSTDCDFHLDQKFKFDLIIANSIFSHMSEMEIENNLRNCFKYIADKGKVWCSLYALPNDFKENKSFDKRFRRYSECDGYLTFSPWKPQLNMAIYMNNFKEIIEKMGFEIDKYIEGYWYKGKNSLDQHVQDIFILSKKKNGGSY